MHPRGWLPGSILLAALMGQAVAADLPLKELPLKPERPAQPAASASPLAAPSGACLEWTDGCRTCQRPPGGEIACSNVGIACVAKDAQCTRQ
jgi:hypothetical protein